MVNVMMMVAMTVGRMMRTSLVVVNCCSSIPREHFVKGTTWEKGSTVEPFISSNDVKLA